MKEPAKAGFFVLAAISMRPASKDSSASMNLSRRAEQNL